MNNLKEISQQAVGKAILSRVVQEPITVYPIVVGILGGFAMLFFDVNFVTLSITTGGITLGLGGFLFNYLLNKGNYANYYMETVRQALIERREAVLKYLERDLTEVRSAKGIKQIKLFHDKYNNLLAILDKKLNPSELTHKRYLTIAEQVFLGGLDNLQSAALALKSISAIDIENINKELSGRGNAELKESLSTRKKLFEDQKARASELIAQNEHALTQLDHVTTKLANIKTGQGHAVMDIDDAMSELRDLIKRADNYSLNK